MVFKSLWHQYWYFLDNLGKKTNNVEATKTEGAKKKFEERAKDRVIDPKVAEEFNQQRLLACISSRPGQSGRADGYIL